MNNKELKILELYSKTNEDKLTKFNGNIESSFTIESNYEKTETSYEWLDIIEDTIRYLDNILRNPNRFIVNEEEIVNVEKARRITVESIKHLSKHTNYIQEINEKDEVKPSKILNINKDESYNTYENRLIYTLINNMCDFVEIKKRNYVGAGGLKDVKRCQYNAVSKVGSERVNINVSLDSKLLAKSSDGRSSDGIPFEERVKKLELQIKNLKNTEVYKMLAKAHVAKIIPPIKKTNLILKNVNFQFAMKLWTYLQTHITNGDKKVKNNNVFENDNTIKQMFDDTFLLNYLIVNSVGTGDDAQHMVSEAERKKAIQELTDSMIGKIVEINSQIPISQLQEEIGSKLAIIRYKKEASLSEIQAVFNREINKFLQKIESFKF